MLNNFESDIKYVPYRRYQKKALEYYYPNKEVIIKKTKININPCDLTKKRRDKKTQNGGQINNHQKKKDELKQKARDYKKKTVIKTI